MLHSQILELINTLEKNVPVNTITYRSVKVWPYIRTQIALQLFNGSPETPKPSHLSGKSFRYRLGYIWAQKRKTKVLQAELAAQGKDPFALGHIDFVYLEKKEDKRILLGKEKINPFADSMTHYLVEHGKCVRLVYADDITTAGSSNGSYPVHHLAMHAELKFESGKYLLGKKFRKHLVNYELLLQEATKHGLPHFYPAEEIADRLEKLFCLSNEFQKLFSRLQPKAVYFAVFYQDYLFAAIMAARKCHAETVDIQHGQQGDKDPFSMNFSVVPEEGYAMLPSVFWVWGKKAMERKKEFRDNAFHRALIGGNPWMALWLHGNHFADAVSGKDAGHFRDGKTNILVALQPVADPIPAFLLDAMRRSGRNVRWFLRMHPAQLRDPSAIRTIADGLENAELEVANQLPLYQLLKCMNYAVTQWSTVAYEALAFGVHPVIIHPNGKELMAEYIDSGIFSYAATADALLTIIQHDSKQLLVPEAERFIETDETIIHRAISEVTPTMHKQQLN